MGKIAGNRNSGEQFWTFGKKGEKIENLTWSGWEKPGRSGGGKGNLTWSGFYSCVRKGDKLICCVKRGVYMENFRFGSFRVLTECSYCGSALVLNGPQRKIVCNSCRKENYFSSEIWRNIILMVDKDTYSMRDAQRDSSILVQDGYTFKISYGRGKPVCSNCQNQLQLDGSIEFRDSVECNSCGTAHSVSSVPSWLEGYQKLKLIGTEAGPVLSEESLVNFDPVSMNCPNCSGALKISVELERLTKCEYCGGEFYIPDPVWNRLHPVKIAKNWYVRFKGKPQWLIKEEKERANWQKQQKLGEAKEKFNRNKLDLKQKISKKQGKWRIYAGVGYFVALMLGIFAIGFPIIFIPSLSQFVGEKICDGEFVRSTRSTNDGTSISFSCKKGNIRKSMDGKMFLYGPGLGVFLLVSIWSLYIPLLIYKSKKRVRALQEELASLEQKGI